jgi:hypothetical protein
MADSLDARPTVLAALAGAGTAGLARCSALTDRGSDADTVVRRGGTVAPDRPQNDRAVLTCIPTNTHSPSSDSRVPLHLVSKL